MNEIQALTALVPQTAIATLDGGGSPSAPAMATGASSVGGRSFPELIESGLNSVNAKLNASELSLQRLAVGDVQNLHEVMIALEESRLSFQLLMQVRSRLLEAYQDVMRMQI